MQKGKNYPYRITISLTKQQGTELETEAQKHDRPIAWVIRDKLFNSKTAIKSAKLEAKEQ
jgi:hypothetical protein